MIPAKEQFQQLYPSAFYLEAQPSVELDNYLQKTKLIVPGERVVSVEIPGKGNMNFVLRIRTDRQTFILKQSRPWVEKYPQVPAPIGRLEIEARYYHVVQDQPTLVGYSSKLLNFDAANFIMALEDLGESSDYAFVYQQGANLSQGEAKALMGYLQNLHGLQDVVFPANLEMRRLNHEHIFRYPFELGNGFDLDTVLPGLQSIARVYQQDTSLKKKVHELGDLYLSDSGNVLVHGDFFPGGWLKSGNKLRVIDFEFAYLGRAEFDLGVFIAHLKMSGHSDAFMVTALDEYRRPLEFDEQLMWAFAGVEIMRRIIGLAQLPLTVDLEGRAALLEAAKRML